VRLLVSDDKIIHFPTDRIVNQRSKELDEQRRKMGEKVAKEIQKQQTKKFVETAVDDISMDLLKRFVDLAMRTQQPQFTKDLALLVDIMRGMIYRDFGLSHPAQKLTDKMVDLKTSRNGNLSAKIDYSTVLDIPTKSPKPISTEIKKELKDLNETQGFFEPDGDLDV
jgi:hypothetical protein